jgi:hypothetical protein
VQARGIALGVILGNTSMRLNAARCSGPLQNGSSGLIVGAKLAIVVFA